MICYGFSEPWQNQLNWEFEENLYIIYEKQGEYFNF